MSQLFNFRNLYIYTLEYMLKDFLIMICNKHSHAYTNTYTHILIHTQMQNLKQLQRKMVIFLFFEDLFIYYV